MNTNSNICEQLFEYLSQHWFGGDGGGLLSEYLDKSDIECYQKWRAPLLYHKNIGTVTKLTKNTNMSRLTIIISYIMYYLL